MTPGSAKHSQGLNGGYRLARCGGATRKRLLQVGDRTGHAITKALREAFEEGDGSELPYHLLADLEQTSAGWRATSTRKDGETVTIEAGAVVLARAAGATRRRRSSASFPPSTTCDRRGDADRPRDRRRGARPRCAPVPPERRRLRAGDDAGLLDPGDDPGLRAVRNNADGEEFTDSLGPRDAVSQAIFDEVGKGKGVETEDGRPAVWLDTTCIPEADAEISLPYMLRRYRGAGIDPLSEVIMTFPVLHYQNGGLVIDEHAETTLEGLYACGEIARHPRPQPDDGQLASGMPRLRPPRRQGGRCESELMTTTVDTDLAGAVEDAAAHLPSGRKDIPQDLRDALAAARDKETSTTGGACST